MKKIKVLRIIARLNIGGPARHTVLLSEGLNRDIFETILVHGIVDKNEGDMAYLAREKGIKSIIIPELSRRISWKNDLIALWKLYRLVKKERPDIIHTHTAKAGTLGRLAGLLYKLTLQLTAYSLQPKLIHTFHGHVLHGYFGRLKSKIFIWIERFLAKFTDRIIAVNERLKQELLNFAIGNFRKIRVIPLGLELDKLLALENAKGKDENSFSVGIVGRLVPIKNHRMFLEVAKQLQTMNSELRTNFFIVGDGELKEKLQEYAKQLGIEDNVAFMGWQKDLDKLYSNLDVITLTSLNEGTPVSLIEAMAAGKPVIAADVGGVRDLVTNHHDPLLRVPRITNYQICERGILVSSGDIKGFAQGLSLLLNNEQLRERMGQSGREFVKVRFGKDRLIKDTENLYQDLQRAKR